MSPVTAIARVCHEANWAYCESQGDHSQAPWDEAPEWQRQSAVNGVLYAVGGTNDASGRSALKTVEAYSPH